MAGGYLSYYLQSQRLRRRRRPARAPVGATDAFSVGCHMPQALRERYGLECVPIPGESLHLYCITRRGDRQREEVARYIKLLEGELDEA